MHVVNALQYVHPFASVVATWLQAVVEELNPATVYVVQAPLLTQVFDDARIVHAPPLEVLRAVQ